MTDKTKISLEVAILITKSGGSLEHFLIQDLNQQKIKAKDALLLAEQGILVPEENIYYEDADIAYDENFDEVTWSKPIPYKQFLQQSLNESKGVSEYMLPKIYFQAESEEMAQWFEIKRGKLEPILKKLLSDWYQTERGIKD